MKKKFSAPVCLFAGWLMLAGTPLIAHAQRDSVTPSNDLATGYSYVGIDLGITGSDYLGSHNFLWGVRTASNLATYLQFNNLGTGIGFVGGFKLGESLGHSFDLEEKVRFITNHTSNQESHPGIYLDPAYPNAQSDATNNYSLMLSSLDALVLGHVRLNNRYYAIGGFGVSDLVKNVFSASQNTVGSYIRLDTHTKAFVSEQQQSEEQLANWFYGFRANAQVGVGSVFRIGANNMLMDAELLVSIPFTQWLTKTADSNLNATAKYWLQPGITDPHLWYASLTVGLRLPFHQIPPPIPEPIALRAESNESVQITSTTLAKNRDTMVLSGSVTDGATGKPLVATLTTVDLANNTVIGTGQTDSNGNYSVSVTGRPGKYSVTASAPGHLFGTAYFEVDSAGRILKNPQAIALSSASNGKTRLLVFFEFDKADLQPASLPELDRAVELMKDFAEMKVEIAGYSDTIGTLQHNLDLSLHRANAVRDFLIAHGITASRITAHGYGPESPIATNTTEEGRAENRRVEFVVKK